MENRRRYPRYGIEFEARIYTEELTLSVTVVDISEGGIGIISERPLGTGGKIFISLFPILEGPIVGTPVWSSDVEKGQKFFYRIGIETEHLALERLKAFGFPISSDLLEIISQNIKTDTMIEEVRKDDRSRAFNEARK